MKKIIVLISGNGSNLQALIDAKIPVILVVSNKENAYGLERAKAAQIPTLVFVKTQDRIEYDKQLAQKLIPYNPDVIVLAGWMHILSEEFLKHFPTCINLHPALPGQFDGMNAIKRAFDAKVKQTGVMVHEVTPIVDRGKVILTKTVDILPTDTLQDLESKMHAAEHEIIVESLCSYLN